MQEFGITLCFDSVTEAKLRALQEQVRLCGVESTEPGRYQRPHITLAVLRGKDSSTLRDNLGKFAAKYNCIETELSSVGLYARGNNDIYLALVPDADLRQFHKACLASVESRYVAFESYHQPERWAPHCTIGYSLPDASLSAAITLCRNSEVFGPTSLVELVVVDVLTETEVESFVLGKRF